MLSIQRILDWWELDDENTGLEDWENNDMDSPGIPYPETFSIYFNHKRYPQYTLMISISLSTWKLASADLWFSKTGEMGLSPVAYLRSDDPDEVGKKIDEWTKNPESFNKRIITNG